MTKVLIAGGGVAGLEAALALHELWGGELYWHDGGHVGHIFSGRVQTVTERFLRGVAATSSA